MCGKTLPCANPLCIREHGVHTYTHMWTLNTWMPVCQCYNTSAVARAVAIACSEVGLQNVSVVRAKSESDSR